MSDEVIEKVVVTGRETSGSDINGGGGGLLNADQADRFLDYMWNSTVLLQQARQVRMRSNTLDIDKLAVGERIVRGATEAVDDGVNAGAVFTKISLTTKKFRLDYEISTESLEDNIEGAGLEDHLARLFATQFGNDLEDIAINGDTASSVPGISQIDGWRKLLLASAHVVEASTTPSGSNLSRATFNKALKAMPRKYMQRRNQLKFFTGSNAIQDYLYSLTQTDNALVQPEDLAMRIINGPVRTEGPAGFTTAFAFGVPVQEVPLFDETRDGTQSGATGDYGDLWLTFPNNLIFGVKREITMHREFKPKKDTTEWTVYTRAGVQVENADAVVVARNVRIAA